MNNPRYQQKIPRITEKQARVAFFKAEIYPLLCSQKLLEPADLEHCATILQESGDDADDLWIRLMEMYNRYKETKS